MSAPNSLQLTELPSLLTQLQRERFYGRISFELRDGEVTLVRTERTQIVGANKHQGVNRDGKLNEYASR